MPSRLTEKKKPILTVRGVKEKKKYEEKSNVKSLFARYFALQRKYLYYIKPGFHLQGSYKRKRKNPYFTVKTACKHKNKLKN